MLMERIPLVSFFRPRKKKAEGARQNTPVAAPWENFCAETGLFINMIPSSLNCQVLRTSFFPTFILTMGNAEGRAVGFEFSHKGAQRVG